MRIPLDHFREARMRHLADLIQRLRVYTADRQRAAYTLMVVGCLIGVAAEGEAGILLAVGVAWLLLERLPPVKPLSPPPEEVP